MKPFLVALALTFALPAMTHRAEAKPNSTDKDKKDKKEKNKKVTQKPRSSAKAGSRIPFDCSDFLEKSSRPSSLVEDHITKAALYLKINSFDGNPEKCGEDPSACAGDPEGCKTLLNSLSYWERRGEYQDDSYPLALPDLKKRAATATNADCTAGGASTKNAYTQGFTQGISGQRLMPGTHAYATDTAAMKSPEISVYRSDRKGCIGFTGPELACCTQGGMDGYSELNQFLADHRNQEGEGRLKNCQDEVEHGAIIAGKYCERIESADACDPVRHNAIRYLSCFNAGFNREVAERRIPGGKGCKGLPESKRAMNQGTANKALESEDDETLKKDATAAPAEVK